MLNALQTLGRVTLGWLQGLGRAGLFLVQMLASLPAAVAQIRVLVQQIYSVGTLSLAIIAISALAVGMVLGLQIYNTLVNYGAEASLGPVVALSLVRELGPVLSALLYSGRAGTALTAEIGLMKATDQLASMEMMAVDPMQRVVAPRFLGGLISVPLLAAIFSAIGIFGSYLVGVSLLGIDAGTFWSQMQQTVGFQHDIVNGIIKSVVFGFVATWIAVFEGYASVPTTEGVSRAITRGVVYSAFAVLGLDFVLTALMFGQ